MAVKIEEVVSLQELVGEFGKRKPVACFSIETFLHAVFCHHVVHGDVFADVAYEVEETVILHPVVVVHEFCAVWCIAFKVEEMR